MLKKNQYQSEANPVHGSLNFTGLLKACKFSPLMPALSRWSPLAVVLLILELCVSCSAQPVQIVAEPSVFTPLLNDSSLSGWEVVNSDDSAFTFDAGTLQVNGSSGWLKSSRQYADFILKLDFRFIEPSSDSGIFLRVEPGTDFILGWPGDSYQIQVRDISDNPGNNPLPLAQLYRHVVPEGSTNYNFDLVNESYTGVGKWQHYEIRVLGRQLTVTLNGSVVTNATGLANLSGHLGIQSERGTVEYRNVEIHEF